MDKRRTYSRRGIILSAAAVGGGLAIGFGRFKDLSLYGVGSPQSEAVPRQSGEIYNWIVIASDNTLTIRIAQMEMGQGAITSMAQLLAEELDADW